MFFKLNLNKDCGLNSQLKSELVWIFVNVSKIHVHIMLDQDSFNTNLKMIFSASLGKQVHSVYKEIAFLITAIYIWIMLELLECGAVTHFLISLFRPAQRTRSAAAAYSLPTPIKNVC